MRLAGHVLIAASFVLPSVAFAQSADCNASGRPGYVSTDSLLYFYGITPEAPTSGTPIRIDTGRIAFYPDAISTTVNGREIDLLVSGTFYGIGVPPPVQCISANVGPLAPGSYTVNATFRSADFLVDDSAPPVTITIAQGGGVPAPAAAPTLSSVVMVVLAGLLAGLGFRRLRKRARA